MPDFIPIAKETIDIITKLNDGVAPVIDETTVYVYNGESEHAEIITYDEFGSRTAENDSWTTRIEHMNV